MSRETFGRVINVLVLNNCVFVFFRKVPHCLENRRNDLDMPKKEFFERQDPGFLDLSTKRRGTFPLSLPPSRIPPHPSVLSSVPPRGICGTSLPGVPAPLPSPLPNPPPEYCVVNTCGETDVQGDYGVGGYMCASASVCVAECLH